MSGVIGYSNTDGSISASYVHFDAGTTKTGQLLHKCHNAGAKASYIAKSGGISYLTNVLVPESGTPHTFNNPQPAVSVFYPRDRNEKRKIHVYSTPAEYRDDLDVQYKYLWINKQWYVSINSEGFFPLSVLFTVDWIARR